MILVWFIFYLKLGLLYVCSRVMTFERHQKSIQRIKNVVSHIKRWHTEIKTLIKKNNNNNYHNWFVLRINDVLGLATLTCICIYTYMYIYSCELIHIHTCTFIYISVYICMYIYVHICLHTLIWNQYIASVSGFGMYR